MAESLSIPVAAQRDPNAINMASIWIAEQGLHCNFKVGVYAGRPDVDEAQAWGAILADLVRHISSALITSEGVQETHEGMVHRIWTAFHEELSKPNAPAPGAQLGGGSQA